MDVKTAVAVWHYKQTCNTETALSINDLWKGPGDLDMQKLYDMMGLKDYETLKKYCTITPVNVPDGYICNVTLMMQEESLSMIS